MSEPELETLVDPQSENQSERDGLSLLLPLQSGIEGWHAKLSDQKL